MVIFIFLLGSFRVKLELGFFWRWVGADVGLVRKLVVIFEWVSSEFTLFFFLSWILSSLSICSFVWVAMRWFFGTSMVFYLVNHFIKLFDVCVILSHISLSIGIHSWFLVWFFFRWVSLKRQINFIWGLFAFKISLWIIWNKFRLRWLFLKDILVLSFCTWFDDLFSCTNPFYISLHLLLFFSLFELFLAFLDIIFHLLMFLFSLLLLGFSFFLLFLEFLLILFLRRLYLIRGHLISIDWGNRNLLWSWLLLLKSTARPWWRLRWFTW